MAASNITYTGMAKAPHFLAPSVPAAAGVGAVGFPMVSHAAKPRVLKIQGAWGGGIFKEFIKSVHYSGRKGDKQNLPNCANCHSSHTIGDVEKDAFQLQVTAQCGSCHGEPVRSSGRSPASGCPEPSPLRLRSTAAARA